MSALLDLNIALFRLVGGGYHPDARLLWAASKVAEGSTWLCVAVMAWAAWRHPGHRLYVVGALLAAGAASILAHMLAEAVAMPRPFVLGLSPPHIEHGVRGSLPSAHASVMFTVGLVFCLRGALRKAGMAILAIALITGWARVYVGVHFPLDVVAGLLLAALIATVFRGLEGLVQRFLVPPVSRDAPRS
ncbi:MULTISPECIES: phosphatase PAP2 family protein [unclassified Variovorax]|uniref:phosphatase PAP2 family protein n=1 Tax=unclassified Variovorax TaxID=663243 RepID=UPI00076DC908|nr:MULTISPECIES: phosphatase PAP2 family protein [unclassified Variovorax]KWT97781.1 Bacitracin transport permease protein BCRC [Variovorax sp. WDL1]PNG52526.1 putative undecaprenyl-diphosphatase YbjG [Variovorax sp. B4]PNG55066.1 putative undecaprenyl-diphosphatase YbjG [Variovorax sp. B2]VTV16096.1 Putative undecaprenyl-diphosphatase YbjG [Variovorax sp. WDL1]